MKKNKALSFFKVVGIGLGILLSTIVIFVTAVWFFPGLILNSSNIARYVEPQLTKREMGISGAKPELHAKSKSFWVKELNLGLKEACIRFDAQKPAVCVDTLKLALSINLKNFGIHELSIDELTLNSKQLVVDITSNEPPSQDKSTFNIMEWLTKTKVGRIEIDLPKLEIVSGKEKFEGSVKLQNTSEVGFDLKSKINSANKGSFDFAEVAVKTKKINVLSEILKLKNANLFLKLSPTREVRAKIAAKEQSATRDTIRLDAELKDAQVKANIELDLEKVGREIKVGLTAKAFLKRFNGPIEINNCRLNATLPHGESTVPVDEAELMCFVNAKTKFLIADAAYLKKLPSKVEVKIVGSVNKYKGVSEDELRGSITAELSPITNAFIEGTIGGKYEIIFSKSNSKINFDPVNITGKILITDFLVFSRFMNSINLLIPSPLNALRGRISIEAKGQVSPSPLKGNLDVAVSTNLNSQSQTLELLAEGKASFKDCIPPEKNMTVSIELVANQMKVRLPNIDYTNPPPLTPDARFTLKSPPKKGSECGLNYDFAFKNKDEPILISGDLLKNDLPVNLSVNAKNNAPLKGYLRIRNYTAEFFRRKGVLETFDLNLETKELSGKLRVDYSEYIVFVYLSGTTQSVRVDMQSDPPLPRDKVMAVLLYGKAPDELDADEAGSVENTNAAVKDNALSLASLYIFASTPIESVGYNPHTSGLTAKVKLGNGTSLNVGANSQGLTDLGVTKRLSKHWRIQTTVKQPGEQEEGGQRSATTLLEWFQRF